MRVPDGTTLAVTGACVLAGELSRTDDIAGAFAAYERRMRPMVGRAQSIPKIFPRLMNPHTRFGIRLLHGALRVASTPAIRRLRAGLSTRAAVEPKISQYPSF